MRYARFRCGKLSARLFPISCSDATSLYRSHRTTDRFADCEIFNLINGREGYERLAATLILICDVLCNTHNTFQPL